MKSIRKHLNQAFGKGTRGRNLLITALLVLCAVQVNALTRDVRTAYQVDEFHREYERQHGLNSNNPDINDIDTWMTFDYINAVFKLPEPYLKTALSIQDPQYPNLHIGKYARTNRLDAETALAKVRSAVATYGTAPATSI